MVLNACCILIVSFTQPTNQAEDLRDVSVGRNGRKSKVLTITSEKVTNNQKWQWPKKGLSGMRMQSLQPLGRNGTAQVYKVVQMLKISTVTGE